MSLVTLETCDQSDEETELEKQKTNPNTHDYFRLINSLLRIMIMGTILHCFVLSEFHLNPSVGSCRNMGTN